MDRNNSKRGNGNSSIERNFNRHQPSFAELERAEPDESTYSQRVISCHG